MISRRAADRPPPGDLLETLARLGEALDAIADAVIAHDRERLDAANARANDLLDTLAVRRRAVEESGIPATSDPEVVGIMRSLRTAVRRNAMLIERAWATDASTTRLLMSLGRGPADSPMAAYAPAPYVAIERSA
jgi:hypothetical protein